MSTPHDPCPGCGQLAQGTFCSHCGTPLVEAPCPRCGVPVAPGARFCSSCGAPIGPAATRATPVAATEPPLHPALVGLAGLLIVAAVAAVVWYLGGNRGRRTPAAAPPSDGSLPAATTDIWSLTPSERFTRLTDRIQAAFEAGDSAQVVQFYPMAEGAFDMLLPGDRTSDARFHIALLRTQVGQVSSAQVQLDSLLLESPDNLLGHYLTAQIATLNRDPAAWHQAKADFDRAWSTEIATDRPEYAAHRRLLDDFHQQSEMP